MRAPMIQLVTCTHVIVSHRGDRSINHGERERESAERSLRGPRKKVNDLGI